MVVARIRKARNLRIVIDDVIPTGPAALSADPILLRVSLGFRSDLPVQARILNLIRRGMKPDVTIPQGTWRVNGLNAVAKGN